MFQTFYDSNNDRFIVAPLRSGSSYTDLFAHELNWQRFNDIFDQICQEDNVSGTHKQVMLNCQPLGILYLLQSEKYKNSKWVTVVRDPMSRYLTSVCMILSRFYEAPQYVPPHEVELAAKSRIGGFIHLENSDYNHVDRLIERRNAKSWFFDFAFSDSHCVPCTSVQLLMCAMKESVETVNLQVWEQWLREHYPEGSSVSLGFYEKVKKRSRRENSNIPKHSYVSVYDRFLKPLIWYNDFEASNAGVEATFSKFIGFEIDAWDILNSPIANKNMEFYQNAVQELLTDPYFITRDPLYYKLYTNASKVLPKDVAFYETLNTIPSRTEELQKFVVERSWLNNDKTHPGSYI